MELKINSAYHFGSTITNGSFKRIDVVEWKMSMSADLTIIRGSHEGAYMRFGNKAEGLRDNYLSITNGSFKIVTIGYVLKSLGCNNVVVLTYLPPASAPGIAWVIFDPNGLVADRLQMDTIVPVEDLMEEYALIDYVLNFRGSISGQEKVG